MRKIVLALSVLMISAMTHAQAGLGEIIGSVFLPSEEPGVGLSVWVDDGDKKYTSKTGKDGRFRISAIPSGEYIVTVKHLEETFNSSPVFVSPDGYGNAGKIICAKIHQEDEVIVDGREQLLKLKMREAPVTELNWEEIEKSPVKFNISDMVAGATSDVKQSEDGELMFRGARKGDMIYVMDGIKMNQVMNLPSCAIKNMIIYSGGIPAKYGDTTGGVIVIESKGYFDLLREYRISQNHP